MLELEAGSRDPLPDEKRYALSTFEQLFQRVSKRDRARSEATLAADIRTLLLHGDLNLGDEDLRDASMESPLGDGTRRRIDIEIGTCIVEVKRRLESHADVATAALQLCGYLHTRSEQSGFKYQGILTDGRSWHLVVQDPTRSGEWLQVGNPLVVEEGGNPELLRYWLAAVLATKQDLQPTRSAIQQYFGADSPAHLAHRATLREMYDAVANKPEVAVKRDLWTKLLRVALGDAFDDDTFLFIDHTLLVLTAEVVAHAVLGIDVSRGGGLPPFDIVHGAKFAQSGIHNVVESDFFDWITEAPQGEQFVEGLAERISRFNWRAVEHDVMKHLYEAVIPADTRRALGEYYTPDWLAAMMVNRIIPVPTRVRVLDASCGSGTFIFHSVRAFLQAADSEGLDNRTCLAHLTKSVVGLDIHPVAVALARVTYLLALGTERLTGDRDQLSIPVHLGDAIQWEQRQDLFVANGQVAISTRNDDFIGEGGGGLFDDDLVFPTEVLEDLGAFDHLVASMGEAVLALEGPKYKDSRRFADASASVQREAVLPILKQHGVSQEGQRPLIRTFNRWYGLHRTGRNHVWGYYARNLVRPIWMSHAENRFDVLIGNPPWLAYSKMHGTMKKRFAQLSRSYGLLDGNTGVSGRDLSTLFVTRAVDKYLKPGGTFAFVMPYGTLTRKSHHAFRGGRWSTRSGGDLGARFGESWSLIECPTGFPIPSCVITGERVSGNPLGASTRVTVLHPGFGDAATSPHMAEALLHTSQGNVVAHDPRDPSPRSPYKKLFRDGAIIYPRRLVCVQRETSGPLGMPAGKVPVRSRTSADDKKPWIIDPLQATVDQEFIFPLALGESIAPFRAEWIAECVAPISRGELMSPNDALTRPGLAQWWTQAEAAWSNHRVKSEKKALAERLDYHGQLAAQLPLERPLRVVYAKSGSNLTAALIRDPRTIIDHKLYWCPADTEEEAYYLLGLLNSAALQDGVSPLQTLGNFGARDFDKYVFNIPFPRFAPSDCDHQRVAEIARRVESLVARIDLTACNYKKARSKIRRALSAEPLMAELEAAAARVIPVTAPEALED